jgi:lysosomal acid lipase/cholesteryl ester hydrolase
LLDVRNYVSGFIAIAPPIRPMCLCKSIFADFAQNNPIALSLLMGSKSFLEFTFQWKQIFSPSMFSFIVRRAMSYLFNWNCKNISIDRQAHFFQNIFTSTSSKVIRHWFQILNSGRLEPYRQKCWGWRYIFRIEKEAPRISYDLSRISCPVAVFAGLS